MKNIPISDAHMKAFTKIISKYYKGKEPTDVVQDFIEEILIREGGWLGYVTKQDGDNEYVYGKRRNR